jgi:hypothetical protein
MQGARQAQPFAATTEIRLFNGSAPDVPFYSTCLFSRFHSVIIHGPGEDI